MPKPHVIVLSITHQGLTKKQVAHKYSVSIRWINMLLARYHEHGLEGLEPRSRRPHKSPNRLSQEVIDQVLAARFELTEQGLDNGPKSIGWRLQNQGFSAPSPASIWRILVRNGAIDPQPKKRPRSSYIRFQAEQPNELWQSDFTHWPLADGTDIEILNWLDDHSRFLLSCTAHAPVRASDVVESFLATVSLFGPPQSTLTDNGLVYTSRFVGGKNPFEYTLGNLGIQQKNGSPGHPQTQGKIERFHQTLKRYLAQQPKAQTVEELQAQLDQFKLRYNTQRPHSSLGQQTPKAVYSQTPKATPKNKEFDAYRVRKDKTDDTGKVTLRREGTLHKLGTGRRNARTPVLLLVDETIVTVTHRHTGEVLSQHLIDPSRIYWPKTTNPQT